MGYAYAMKRLLVIALLVLLGPAEFHAAIVVGNVQSGRDSARAQIPPTATIPNFIFTGIGLDHKIRLEWSSAASSSVDGYAFEGYTLFQSRSPWGAWQRVANWDISNGVDTIWDSVFSTETGRIEYVPVRYGTNNGLVYSFETSQNPLSSTRLYNQNNYYFRIEPYSYCASCTPKTLSSAATVTVTPLGEEPLQVNLTDWPVSQGGNGHWYAVLPLQLPWTRALTAVDSQVLNGKGAHLATIESQEENDFVLHSVLAGLASPSQYDGFWLGARDSNNQAWRWITGEAFGYSNIAPGMSGYDHDSNAIAVAGPLNSRSQTPPGSWFGIPCYYPCEYCQWAVMEWDEFSPTDVTDQSNVNLPLRFELQQNYPNPFNPSTTIAFQLPHTGHVSIEVFDVLGRHVASIFDGALSSGRHFVTWDGHTDRGQPVPSGVYLYHMKTGEFSAHRKMLLLK
jgi:hypothetical protein